MKIGIVTITEGDNFGNRLQNYALQETLKKLGHTVETIPNYIVYGYRRSRKYQIKEFVHAVRKYNPEMLAELIKQYRFARFDKKYFKFSCFYSDINYISPELDAEFDCFVAGSDQIWNPYFPFNHDFNFLAFAPEEKRVAYAASFGTDHVWECRKDKFREYLKGFRKISVREYAGQKIVHDLIGRDVPVLLDPTLLLSQEEWQQIEKKPRWLRTEDKFILTYYLGSTEERKQFLDELYVKYPQYKEVRIIDIHNRQLIKEFSITPAEFIWMIHHAEIMLTDSFHGMVFSILMKTPFVPIKRMGDELDMTSRIKSLFTILELEQTEMLVDVHLETNGKLQERLKIKRKEAVEYLKRAVQSKGEEQECQK